MRRILEHIFNNKFFRSIATLMSGSLIAQVISFFVAPLMTRLYTEEQIGEYTLLLTAVTMFGSVICGRYDMSIVSEKNSKKVYAIIKLSFVLTFILSVLVGVGYTVYFCIVKSLNMSFVEIFVWIFIFLFLTGIGNILQSYNNRDREYKLMASVNITKEIAKAVSLLGLGFIEFGTIGLLVSYLVSCFMGIQRQAKRLKYHLSSVIEVSYREMMELAQKHRRQPLFSVPASFANSFAYSIINIFVDALFGTVVLAHYSISYRILGVPLSLVSGNTSKAYYEKATREYEQTGNYNRTFLQTSIFLFAIAVPMVVVLMIFAPWFFEVFFGKGWGVAGEYVRYLAPMFGIRLIVSALTPTMIICNKQKVELLFQLFFVIASFVAYLIGRQTQSIGQFMISITVLFSIVYILFYVYMLRLSLKKEISK